MSKATRPIKPWATTTEWKKGISQIHNPYLLRLQNCKKVKINRCKEGENDDHWLNCVWKVGAGSRYLGQALLCDVITYLITCSRHLLLTPAYNKLVCMHDKTIVMIFTTIGTDWLCLTWCSFLTTIVYQLILFLSQQVLWRLLAFQYLLWLWYHAGSDWDHPGKDKK